MVKQIGQDPTTLFPIVEDDSNPGVALEVLFNVLNFGMVGDRVTDNSAAMPTMMNHLRTLTVDEDNNMTVEQANNMTVT